MERVKYGEHYWTITETFQTDETTEFGSIYDDRCWYSGNYFLDEQFAEAMAAKLRAVLKGAGVIEMPSEEEFYKVAPSTNKLGGYSLENQRQVRGFQDCWDWIKSKIVK